MTDLFKTRIVANLEERRTEAQLRPMGTPDDEEPWAIAFESEVGWGMELPHEWDFERFPTEATFEALEHAGELLESYPNRVGSNAPRGASRAELEEWLLEVEPVRIGAETG